MQYNATLAINSAIGETSQTKLRTTQRTRP